VLDEALGPDDPTRAAARSPLSLVCSGKVTVKVAPLPGPGLSARIVPS
jgi:hypothetical protein